MLKCPQPLANLFAEGLCSDTPKRSVTEFESPQGSSQQGGCPFRVSSFEVVERRRRLNQRLQKALLRLLQSQPNALPMLVGEEEFRVPVAAKALGKLSRLPVKGHIFSIGLFASCRKLPSVVPAMKNTRRAA